jgi:methyl halide transferase
MTEFLSGEYWSKRFQNQDTPWDAGAPTPPLQDFIDGLTDKHLAILIPGCGHAYEAQYLLEKGFTNVTVLDIASEPLEVLRQKLEEKGLQNKINLVNEDFFAHTGQYDLILEQTFFCALFDRFFEDGPPFGGSEDEYRIRFSPPFKIKTLEPCLNSHPKRAGTELFIEFRK